VSRFGIVVAAHGGLGSAFLESARMIVGELSAAVPVDLDPSMNLESMLEQMEAAVREVDGGQGALLLLDLFGGTPCNAAAMLMQKQTCLAITGLNLPMLLEVALQRDTVESLSQLARLAQAAGGAGIVDVKARFDSLSAAD
jgi:mannose/fructose/sorbose-specific phosphotransferase system IIA component